MEVFLSYASEDEKLAEDVALAIAGGGYKVFFDHKTLRAGGGLSREVARSGKARTPLRVFLISADSIAPRKYALTELKYRTSEVGPSQRTGAARRCSAVRPDRCATLSKGRYAARARGKHSR